MASTEPIPIKMVSMSPISMSAQEFIRICLDAKIFERCKHLDIPWRRVIEKVILCFNFQVTNVKKSQQKPVSMKSENRRPVKFPV